MAHFLHLLVCFPTNVALGSVQLQGIPDKWLLLPPQLDQSLMSGFGKWNLKEVFPRCMHVWKCDIYVCTCFCSSPFWHHIRVVSKSHCHTRDVVYFHSSMKTYPARGEILAGFETSEATGKSASDPHMQAVKVDVKTIMIIMMVTILMKMM